MLEVAGKPIVGHILDRVLTVEPAEVCVVVAPDSGPLQAYLSRHYRCEFRFVVQHESRGLGDAVGLCRPHFAGEPVLIVLGDTIVDTDFPAFVSSGSSLAIMPVVDPEHYGVAEVEGRRIVRLVEKPLRPRSDLALVGLYYFRDSRRLFDAVDSLKASGRKTRGEYQLTDAIQAMLAGGERITARRVKAWLDCGTVDALLRANSYLLRKRRGSRELRSCVVVPPVFVAPSADVRDSVIGPDVSIGSGAQVAGSVIRDSVVHARAQVRGVLLEHSVVGEDAVVAGKASRLNLGSQSVLSVG